MTTIKQQIAYQHKIAYYLGMTYLEYERVQDFFFKKWCYANSQVKGWNYRAMLSNDHLRNWFAEKWHTNVEQELQRSYDDFLDNGVLKDDELLYTIVILFKTILEVYPKVLVEMISERD